MIWHHSWKSRKDYMLRTIHVKNIALIDDVEIELNNGMHVLSGETGAGKSIIIDAVNFALGRRMPRDVVREDAEYALCELFFSVDNDEQRQLLKALDLPEEDDSIILQRKIVNGRSICRVNGESVSTGALKELASVLIDIHGQHEHQSLLYQKKHMEILDAYCGSQCHLYLEQLADEYREYNKVSKEYEEALTSSGNKERDAELAEFELEEIDAAHLQPGEDEELESAYRKMSNAKRIAEAVAMAHNYTGYDSEGGAGSSIGRAVGELRTAADYDEEAEGLLEMLTDIDNLLNDFNRNIADYEKGLYFEEQEFAECEERLNLVNRMKDKYGNSIEEVLSYRDQLEAKLAQLADYDAFLADLKRIRDEKRENCLLLCKNISAIRQKEAVNLAAELREGLIDLNFLDARFEILVEPDEEAISATGYDHVEFMISTNPGEKVKPLINVASGGELSRIMLALKAVLSERDHVPTLIFDEIDTGISGRTAQKVSEKLAVLSSAHQVICVTHLPQIASMADVHYEIKKGVENGRTTTTVTALTEEEAVTELARMLSGTEVTDAVLQNAKEMKALANELKRRNIK